MSNASDQILTDHETVGFRILTRTHLNPSNGIREYGEIWYEIVAADAYELKYDGTSCNNVFQDYSEDIYQSREAAQAAIDDMEEDKDEE